MPTIFTHPLVAVAMSPWFGRRDVSDGLLLSGALCTILPDLDVIGLRLGIPYDSMFGHRGFTHSLSFAVGLAILLSFVFVGRGTPFLRAFAFLFVCTASHGFLDALTNGGYGVAFLAPFSDVRYFSPWRPIEVSTLNLSRFFAGRGIPVLLSEFVWIVLPCLAIWLVGRAIRRMEG